MDTAVALTTGSDDAVPVGDSLARRFVHAYADRIVAMADRTGERFRRTDGAVLAAGQTRQAVPEEAPEAPQQEPEEHAQHTHNARAENDPDAAHGACPHQGILWWLKT